MSTALIQRAGSGNHGRANMARREQMLEPVQFTELDLDRGLLIHHGTSYWTGLPALPPRGHQAVLERNAVRHPQVRRGSSRRRAGHAPVRRGKASEYAIRLREKQKVKRYYGVFERQFRKYYEEASRRPATRATP